jgi:hypothetical protein
MQPRKGSHPTPGGLTEQPPNPAHQIPGEEHAHTTDTESDPATSNTPAGDSGWVTWLRSQGYPDDAVLLAGHPDAPPPPMSTPPGMAGLIVNKLDLAADDTLTFTAGWIPQPETGNRGLDGQVYLTLTPTTHAETPTPGTPDTPPDTTVDIGIQLITTGGHHRLIQQWSGLGQDWPHIIAAHVAATMYTHHD